MIKDDFNEDWDLNCGRCHSFQVSFCKMHSKKVDRHGSCPSFQGNEKLGAKADVECENCLHFATYYCHTLKINLKNSAGICSQGVFRKL